MGVLVDIADTTQEQTFNQLNSINELDILPPLNQAS